ncbi:hypothetical protein CBR_g30238 [Chara braunii]|uniref:Uncharacterized protein n=1 Tax=Chara braunii TaxID=69332 RepID=A0A388LCG3_CHABU|nr:hypothetical protein CBR_g30238 [Chara braunii]|eukprot:GBG79976.1 hypothetical protein CBR_g30238 [Chara braunii]
MFGFGVVVAGGALSAIARVAASREAIVVAQEFDVVAPIVLAIATDIAVLPGLATFVVGVAPRAAIVVVQEPDIPTPFVHAVAIAPGVVVLLGLTAFVVGVAAVVPALIGHTTVVVVFVTVALELLTFASAYGTGFLPELGDGGAELVAAHIGVAVVVGFAAVAARAWFAP